MYNSPMTMRTEIKAILTAAMRAPSGENAQPWRFRVQDAGPSPVIDVCVHAEADQSLYNWHDRASCVAVGAAIENIRIAAPGQGYRAEVTLFPDPQDELYVARITLEHTVSTPHELESAIEKRATNRKPYATTLIGKETLDALAGAAAHVEGTRVFFTTDREDMRRLAAFGSLNERIMLNNERMHEFFFSHINWSRQADEQKRTGFFIETLELPPPAKIGFKVLSSWSRASFLNTYLKFNEVVAAQNAATYTQAGAYGMIATTEESARAACTAGQAFESIWLAATHAGLSMQPLIGTIFLGFAARAHAAGLNDAECALIEKESAILHDVFPAPEMVTYALFRLGYAQPPSARSIRKNIEDVLITSV